MCRDHNGCELAQKFHVAMADAAADLVEDAGCEERDVATVADWVAAVGLSQYRVRPPAPFARACALARRAPRSRAPRNGHGAPTLVRPLSDARRRVTL